MAWDDKRKSHQGLIDAGYFLHEVTNQYPAECRFCHKPIMWYVSKNFKVQPFTAGTFEPHHSDCLQYAEARKRQKAANPGSSGMPPREPGDETQTQYPD